MCRDYTGICCCFPCAVTPCGREGLSRSGWTSSMRAKAASKDGGTYAGSGLLAELCGVRIADVLEYARDFGTPIAVAIPHESQGIGSYGLPQRFITESTLDRFCKTRRTWFGEQAVLFVLKQPPGPMITVGNHEAAAGH